MSLVGKRLTLEDFRKTAENAASYDMWGMYEDRDSELTVKIVPKDDLYLTSVIVDAHASFSLSDACLAFEAQQFQFVGISFDPKKSATVIQFTGSANRRVSA